MRKVSWIPALVALAMVACADSDTVGPDPDLGPAAARTSADGGVYTMTNAAANEVVQYRRSGDGELTLVSAYATGGAGTAGGLGNQGGIAISDNGRWLLAVNAASNELSVFRRSADGSLALVERAGSGGMAPISVTQSGPWVYVLNEGGDGNIAGFRLGGDGSLTLLGTRPLSQAGGVDPAQVSFSPNGRALVVTEKNTDRIVVYPVRAGHAGAPIVHDSDGPTPFGFGFTRDGTLIVSNAAGGAAGAGSVSSYAIGSDGSLHVIDAQVPDFQSAPCWIAITRNGGFAYTTNTATNNTSGYRITAGGGLDLLGDGDTAANSGGPIDAAINPSGAEYLHVLNAATGAIEVFAVHRDGSLTPVDSVDGLPAGTNGLAAY